ncbi:carbohydrate-binding module family 18 protein [Piromyces sp. E2]|nr:carbohydrate-binding module family 18 protein [Piromyces sp. E2]|eukprot:OUM63558.1 carbohydrate-binding module family 18 protein [Piromyces sp. E2]
MVFNFKNIISKIGFLSLALNSTITTYALGASYKAEKMVESYDYLLNPYIGWYHGPDIVRLSDDFKHDCAYYDTFNYVQNDNNKSEYGLQYLGVTLEEYRDRDITETGLKALRNVLDELRNRKKSRDPHTQVIINFYYDNDENCQATGSVKYFHSNISRYRDNASSSYNMKINGKTVSSNDGCYRKVKTSDSTCTKIKTENIEPTNINQVLRHVEQVADIINEYKDIIYIARGVLIGTWGEMHGSKFSNLDGYTKIMKKMHKLIDPSIYLSVRTPEQRRGILNKIKEENSSMAEQLSKRLGHFNDGLFDRETDSGTYTSREYTLSDIKQYPYEFVRYYRDYEEEYQNKVSLTVPNGGESVYNEADTTYKSFDVSDKHSRKIRLSYLNPRHHQSVYTHWESTKPSIKNWGNGKDYIGKHLGYRYVLRESSLNNNILNIKFENVGYAPSYKDFQTKLIFKPTSSGDILYTQIDTNNKVWCTSSNNIEILKINLDQQAVKNLSNNSKSNFKNQKYDVYFLVNDVKTQVNIKFANTNTFNNQYGYKIGEITISNSAAASPSTRTVTSTRKSTTTIRRNEPTSTSKDLPVSTDECGASVGKRCAKGLCCSKYGWCGKSSDYCDNNCQSEFGDCRKSLNDKDRCGQGVGRCAPGYCCSKYGWCGKTSDHCGVECQPKYGICGNY